MSIIKLQEKIGAKADGSLGPNTLKKAMEFYKMTPERAAHFFGQTSHETGGFKVFSENLNYSANGLANTFPTRYAVDSKAKVKVPNTLANNLAKNPEKIANNVYASRMGNGDEKSGDGWKFRGRGALQLTGKDNYKAFSESLKRPEIITNPDLVANELAFESAIFFFDKNKLWNICDKGINDETILALTRRINGGTHGLDDRNQKTKTYYKWLTS
jgi:putative chitinase